MLARSFGQILHFIWILTLPLITDHAIYLIISKKRWIQNQCLMSQLAES